MDVRQRFFGLSLIGGALVLASNPANAGSTPSTSSRTSSLSSALLTAREVGAGFTARDPRPPKSTSGPCDVPNKIKPAERVGVQFDDADKTINLQQDIRHYADAASAAKQFAAARVAVAKCSGKTITVGNSYIFLKLAEPRLKGVDDSLAFSGNVRSSGGVVKVVFYALRSRANITTISVVSAVAARPGIEPVVEAARVKLLSLV